MFDLLIKNGRVVDGSGNPWTMADVAVKDGRIAAVGRLGGATAATVADATGRVVCPGFIDGHSHSDLYVLAAPESRQKIMQGFTTEVVGLDGMSVAPISEAHKPGWRKHLSGLAGNPGTPWSWNSMGGYLDAVDATPAAVNICSYAGLGTIRLNVVGMDDRAPTADEMEQMRRLTAEAMEQGARGVSAGLIYPPSQYQSLEEIVALCRVAARYDGIFDVHMRNESDRIAESVEEVLEVGRRAGIPVLITHFKVRGRKNWGSAGRLLERLEKARADGIDVTPSQYPYTAGSTFLHAVIPPWYHTRGADASRPGTTRGGPTPWWRRSIAGAPTSSATSPSAWTGRISRASSAGRTSTFPRWPAPPTAPARARACPASPPSAAWSRRMRPATCWWRNSSQSE